MRPLQAERKQGCNVAKQRLFTGTRWLTQFHTAFAVTHDYWWCRCQRRSLISDASVLPFMYHQRLHFFGGFIADEDGQLNSRENSRELESEPITRNFASE